MLLLTPWCLLVVPAIEKLLSSDWKERFLGRSSVETKDVKGEGGGGGLTPFPFSQPGRAVWACRVVLEALGPLIPARLLPGPGVQHLPSPGD